MKYSKWYGLMFLLFIFLVTGCGKQIKPEDNLNTYVSAWMKLDYAGMYDQLSIDSKKAITKDDFIKRYDDIYKGIEAKQLNVTFDPPNQNTSNKSANEVEITYHVKMATMAGPISFDHQVKMVKEEVNKETRWDVTWDPSLIFPQMTQGDKVRVQVTKAQRGEIKDRNGVGLAVNGTATVIGVVPEQLGDQAEQTKQKLADMLHITKDEINKDLQASWVKPNLFVPIATVPDDQVSPYLSIKGVATQKKGGRQYPLGEAAAHLTGYVGSINADELEKMKDKGYKAGDIIGKAGLEQVFEDQLRGKDGVRIYIVDSKGADKQTLVKTDPVQGQTITTTIDSTVQQAVFAQLKPDASTATVIQPTSGEILALVSSPSYDPNQMVLGVSKTQWDQWNNDPQKPLLNRFTQAFVPGSSFKVITAAIGLNTHTLDPTKIRTIDGLHWTKDSSWGSYYITRVHDLDQVNLQKGFVYSDNIYFAQTALDIGKENFMKGAESFGIGEKLPLPYPFEVSKVANNGIANEIQLADSGYGQGEVQMTALQLALSYAPLVNAGNIPYPSLTLNDKDHPKTWKENVMSQDTINEIKNDLIQVVNSPDGTGRKAAIPNMNIAGKTGTAELKKAKGEDGVEYGWFVGFNADHPQYLVSMMVEDVKNRGGSGYVAAKVRSLFQTTLK